MKVAFALLASTEVHNFVRKLAWEIHQKYRTNGFREIEAYEGSEIPKEFQDQWVFMERVL
jgi:hypothetical protein